MLGMNGITVRTNMAKRYYLLQKIDIETYFLYFHQHMMVFSSKLIDTTSPVIDILIPENDSVYNLDDDSSIFNIILELKENIWCRSRSDEFNFIAFTIQSTTGY